MVDREGDTKGNMKVWGSVLPLHYLYTTTTTVDCNLLASPWSPSFVMLCNLIEVLLSLLVSLDGVTNWAVGFDF